MTTAAMDRARVDRALTGFYVVVALIALAGQAGAAVRWLGWPLLFALAAVGAVEFGGIALSAYADYRRRLGERAMAARLLSAAVAAGAVAVNWLGHDDRLQGGFFAGMSALGYLVWLLHSGARRRDQLRAAGTLPPVPPVYGIAEWVKHPGLTRRARAMALADPSLGLYGSLEAARTAERTQHRRAAIATALRRKLTAAVDPVTAEIATATFDLDKIAARLAAGADYDGLTALIAADLSPNRLTGATSLIGDGSTADTRDGSPADWRDASNQGASVSVNAGRNPLVDGVASPPPVPAEPVGEPTLTPVREPVRKRVTPPSLTTAHRVTAAHAKEPDATHARIAELAGVSVATVKRHRPTGSPTAPSPAPTPVLADAA